MTVKITHTGRDALAKLGETDQLNVLTAARALGDSTDHDQQLHLGGRYAGCRLRRIDSHWGILYQIADSDSKNIETGDIIVLVLIDLQEIAELGTYWSGRPSWRTLRTFCGWPAMNGTTRLGAALIDEILLGNLWLEMADLGVYGA